MNNYNYRIEIKKLVLADLMKTGIPPSVIIQELLQNFLLISDINANADIYTNATEYLLAYLQMGFSYLENKELFDKILYRTGWSTSQITTLQKNNYVIYLNKAQIRSILGRWPASRYNSHTITEVIDNIIYNVNNDNIGNYEYFTAKKDGSLTAFYRLTIFPEYYLFHDVTKNKFYRLIKK